MADVVVIKVALPLEDAALMALLVDEGCDCGQCSNAPERAQILNTLGFYTDRVTLTGVSEQHGISVPLSKLGVVLDARIENRREFDVDA